MTLSADARRERLKHEYNAALAGCPARQLLEIVGSKWTTLVLLELSNGALRHGELRARLAGASQKMLTSTLRSLERDGFLAREVKAVFPAHVEYSLTELGESLLPIVQQMKLWAEENVERVLENRAERSVA